MNKTNVGANSDTTYVIIDVVTVFIGFLISYLFFLNRFTADSLRVFIVLALVQLIIYLLNNKKEYIYNVTMFFYLDRVYRKITKSYLIGAIVTSCLLYFVADNQLEPEIYLLFLVMAYLLLCFTTMFLRKRFVNVIYRKSVPRTAFVGNKEAFNKFNYYLNKTSIRIEPVGYICMNRNDMTEKYIGCLEDLEDIIREYNLDQVYIMQKREDNLDYIQHYIDLCIEMGVTCRVVVNFYKRRKANSYVSSVGTYPIITYHTISLNNYERIIKRCVDIIGGLVGVILASPIMLVTAIAIKIDSPGPVLFCQTRVGQNGRHFKIYKFRSMFVDAEARKQELMEKNEIEGGVMFKMKDDPRITRVGKFIRKMSIDELPQFFNVLGGSMSLVGTRPPTVDEVEKYERKQWRRISIKPGITGMWQVNGRSEVTTFEEIVQMDTEYIDTWDLLLDIKIMMKTVAVLIKREGAY